MVKNVAPLLRELEAEDIYLLSGLEHGMRFGEWVDREKLSSFASLEPPEVDHRLDRCLGFELIERQTMQYEGYRLKFEGYDALALHTFAERETVTEVGAPLGVGKESDVLEVRGEDTYALKFHREGITNFREVNREREYTADREHVSWLYTARKAAEREYEILTTLHPAVAVPEPIDHNRHALVMERLPGRELAEVGVADDDAAQTLFNILQQMAGAHKRGFVHADMSAYNIFVSPGRVTVIDWPQAVSTEHPNARELLERDLENVVSFFRRKFPNQFDNLSENERLSGLIRNYTILERDNLSELYTE